MKLSMNDLIGAVDGLSSAVEELNEHGGGHSTQPVPITKLLKSLDAARALGSLTRAEVCALTDRWHETRALVRRFGPRLRFAIGDCQHLPDPGPDLRPTAGEALEADTTAHALGALLRIADWVERLHAAVEKRGGVADDI